MTRKIILRNALILRPGDNPAFIERGDIYIDGANIVAIEGEGHPFTDFTADEIVDLSNCVVHPGFINTHTHTPLTYLRGLAQDVGLADFFGCLTPHAHLLSKEHAYWSSMLAQIEMIRNGITTFVDACEWMDEVGRAAQQSGLRAVLGSEIGGIRPLDGAAQDLAYTIGDSQYVWDDDYGMQRLSEALRDIAASRALNCSRLTNFLSPHAIYSCSPTLLQEIARCAKESKLPVSIHFAEDEEIETQIRRRHASSVILLKETGLLDGHCLGVHCIYLDESEIRALEGTSFAVAHCLGSNLKLGEKPAPLSTFLDHGIPVGLGTDSVMSNDNLDILEEARLTALVHKTNKRDPSFLSGDFALQMATCMGARVIGLENKIGCLKPGYFADLIIFDTSAPHWIPAPDPMMTVLYAASSRDITHLMVGGNWVMKDREILTLNEEDVFSKASEATRYDGSG